jgi:predicted nucleic acid-binding protein
MLIVSDTGPLRYLIETGTIDVLPRLYNSIWTTPMVIGELGLPHFPSTVQQWAQHPPEWLIVQQPQVIDFLDRLDAGEASALSLAVERGNCATIGRCRSRWVRFQESRARPSCGFRLKSRG